MKARLRKSLSISALVGACLAGCLDFTSIAPASTGDAGPEDAGGATKCLSCAGGADDAGGCSNEYAQCNGFPDCKATIDCVVDQCFHDNANIGQCLSGCESTGGITVASSLPKAAFAAFLQCMSTNCQSQCLQ